MKSPTQKKLKKDRNSQMSKAKAFWRKLFSSSGWAFFVVCVWELVEECLENLLALALSSASAVFVAKALSTLAIVTTTKVGIKKVTQRFLFPFFKKLFYKEGNDKMEKLKKLWSWIVANKCTLLGIGTGAVVAVTGSGVIDADKLPALVIGSVNITPILYGLVLGVLTIVASFFPETVEKFKARIAEKKAEKEAKAIEKEAQKELVAEEKLATQTQAEKEKADAKKLAEEKAKLEKEKAEKEHRAKIELAKAELKKKQAELNNQAK